MRQKILSTLKKIIKKIKNRLSPSESSPTSTTPSDMVQSSPPPAPKQNKSPSDSFEKPISLSETTKTENPDSSAEVQSNIEVEAIETPNPNAYKFKVNTKVSASSFSIASLEEAEGNPLAQEIIQLEGVASIFGVHDFITVSKSSAVSWEPLNSQIVAILKRNLSK